MFIFQYFPMNNVLDILSRQSQMEANMVLYHSILKHDVRCNVEHNHHRDIGWIV
jgi:hypothetical protein